MSRVDNHIACFDSHRRIVTARYNSPRACLLGAVLWQCMDFASAGGQPPIVTDRAGLNDISPGYAYTSAKFAVPIGIAMQSLPAAKNMRMVTMCKSGTVEFEPRITITPSDIVNLAGKPIIVDDEGKMLAVSASELLMNEAVMKTSSLSSDDGRVVLKSQTLASGVYYQIGYFLGHTAPSRWVSGVEVYKHSRLMINFDPKYIFVKE